MNAPGDARLRAEHAAAEDERTTLAEPPIENAAKRPGRRRRAHGAGSSQARREGGPATDVSADPTLDSVQLFFRQASRYPLLTAADEVELAKRIERGDVEAKDRMINSNLRLVISQARRYQHQGLSLGDLIQEGMLGLIRAVEKFDWRRGFKFSTYGTLWIRQSIQRGLANSSRAIRVPVHIGQRERKVRKIEQELASKLTRDPTDEEIAEAAELPVEQVLEAREFTRSLASLDQAVGEDGETALGELLPSDRPSPEEEVGSSLGNQRVRQVVGQLPEAERKVVTLRFGLAGEEPKSLREAGAELGMNTERARQLEEQALRLLAESGELKELREAA
jgi:RNA polymerase sigma factor (sigma-70 family)